MAKSRRQPKMTSKVKALEGGEEEVRGYGCSVGAGLVVWAAAMTTHRHQYCKDAPKQLMHCYDEPLLLFPCEVVASFSLLEVPSYELLSASSWP
jgi:hypothetical protein